MSTKNRKQKRLQIKTSIEDIPLDVSFNFLKQLPITALLSFKLASKACYNMATNPLLTPKYQHHKDNPNCLMIVPLFLQKQRVDHLYLINNHKHNRHKENEIRDGKFLESINRSMIDKGFMFNTLLSSNGLLCLVFCKSNGSDYRVCLCNPLTSEHHFLPDPELARAGDPTQSTIDAVTSKQCFGFGYDSRTRKYKVVRIERSLRDQKSRREGVNNCGNCLEIEVLTLGENGSRKSQINNLFHVPEKSSDVELGGAIHWLWKGTIAENYILASFDLLKENWVMNEKPNFVMGTDYILSVFGGCLALTVSYRARVDIWKIMENGVRKSWTREFVIEGFPFPGMIYPLFVLSSGRILVAHENEGLYSYNPESECFIGIYIPRLLPKYLKVICCYTPSLVSPIFWLICSLFFHVRRKNGYNVFMQNNAVELF